MWVLGLNAPPLGWHDPCAALVDGDGRVVATVEEERPSRIKHGLHRFPHDAVAECLRIGGVHASEIDVVAVGWDLPRHYPRRDRDALDPPLPGRLWEFGDVAEFRRLATGIDTRADLVFVPHHLAHATLAFHASGASEAGVLITDGNGDDESISIFEARLGQPLVCRERHPVTTSLGYLYDAGTTGIGLTFLEAGQTMGLAAYGRARADDVPVLLTCDVGGPHPPFALPTNAEYDAIVDGWRRCFAELELGGTGDRDSLHLVGPAVRLAWTVQRTVEVVQAQLVERTRRATGIDLVCLAGGVALNCSANGTLPGPVYVPPVPHDGGIALGAAWHVSPPRTRSVLDPYLGGAISDDDAVVACAGRTTRAADPGAVAALLDRGKIGAFAFGAAEIGPRALLHRSVVAVPDSTAVRDEVNRRKDREPWRPLSPAAPASVDGGFWAPSPLHRYMIGATPVHDEVRADVPGIVHVDGTARPQSVPATEHFASAVFEHLEARGRPPVLLNTSLNRRGEPLVDSARGAIETSEALGLDFLVLHDRLLEW